MRLVAYIRTSTGAANGDSLGAQEDACRDWADQHGHELAAVHVDDGISGGLGADERPGLLAAIAEIEDGRARGLVIHRLDRLARELHVQEAALARIWGAGDHASVFEAVEGEVLRDDPDDPHRRFLRQVMGAASELERGLIRARLRRGRQRKADQGGYIGGHTVPFGYRVAPDGRITPDPDQQASIRRIIALRRSGHTWKQVAETPGVNLHPNGVKKIFRRETGETGGRVHRAKESP